MKDDPRYQAAIAAFDRANAADPNRETVAGVLRPKQLLQAERFTAWLRRVRPDAPEPLWLAVRAQHICRWQRPRSDHEAGRIGYLRWRKDLARFHADTAGHILEQVGYDATTVARVRELNLKKNIKADADAQTLEDVLCLSFIEHEFTEFSQKHSAEKIRDILIKTWGKMSPQAQALAQQIELPAPAAELLAQALSASAG
jgi:hypothetical protein